MIDGDVERRASVHIPKVRIAAMFQEKLRGVVIVVVESNHHRTGAFRRRQVDVRARADQRLDAG